MPTQQQLDALQALTDFDQELAMTEPSKTPRTDALAAKFEITVNADECKCPQCSLHTLCRELEVSLSDVISKVREIHEVMKRGKATGDHGLNGNLACILDSICSRKEAAAERTEQIGRLEIVNADLDSQVKAAEAYAEDRLRALREIYSAAIGEPGEFAERILKLAEVGIDAGPRDIRGFLEIGTGNPKPVGRCATTQTERYRVEGCTCPTYPGNEGLPCLTWCQSRAADRCAYCDHNLECHRRLSAMFKGSHAVGTTFEGLAHYVPPSYSRILWRGAYLDLPSMQVPSQWHADPADHLDAMRWQKLCGLMAYGDFVIHEVPDNAEVVEFDYIHELEAAVDAADALHAKFGHESDERQVAERRTAQCNPQEK